MNFCLCTYKEVKVEQDSSQGWATPSSEAEANFDATFRGGEDDDCSQAWSLRAQTWALMTSNLL